MSEKRKVLMTGACGVVSSLLISELNDRYDLVLTDVKQRQGNRSGIDESVFERLQVADLVDPNRDNYRHLFEGVDAVIHNAFVGRATLDVSVAEFEHELANVRMAYNIYQTALEENVRRVVVTSSNHASDYYEEFLLGGTMDYVSPETQNRAFTYYGWAKDSYEHLGFLFALGRSMGMEGRKLQNVHIRIGGPRETDVENCELGDLQKVRRALAVYARQRALVQLYVKSIETESIEDKRGVPFQIFYGISGNTHAYWSLVNAREVIGYEPQDNSELRFADAVHKHIAAAEQANS